ncbi:hypothetical protein JM47_02305 [Ureaplasma diversum]|uniref:adenosylhomocysteine nucleosidase n=1 Tax=Ureaplasma diversum TaxID=42094 RepID=A0A0C5RPV4_9BACT|nr:5'-methylthioadenosine/S-adenosylhomocysteine nucleosidase [Ureaplasma diversum]AJQ45399.1 hypothetical protein JM47_02305 [Ureaplasma diversum]
MKFDIGIVVALKDEIKTYFKKLTNKKVVNVKNNDFYLFTLDWNDQKINCVLAFCDVGKVNAAICSSLVAECFGVELILNVGSCGAVNPNLKPLDLLLVKQTQYLDVDLVAFNYEQNQIPRRSKLFNIKDHYINSLTQLLAEQDKQTVIARVGSCDQFINVNNIDQLKEKEIDAIDMELAAIAHVCEIFKCDLVSIKLISDQIYYPNNNDTFKKNLSLIDQWFNQHLNDVIKLLVATKDLK